MGAKRKNSTRFLSEIIQTSLYFMWAGVEKPVQRSFDTILSVVFYQRWLKI
jgi:hypothetical protein